MHKAEGCGGSSLVNKTSSLGAEPVLGNPARYVSHSRLSPTQPTMVTSGARWSRILDASFNSATLRSARSSMSNSMALSFVASAVSVMQEYADLVGSWLRHFSKRPTNECRQPPCLEYVLVRHKTYHSPLRHPVRVPEMPTPEVRTHPREGYLSIKVVSFWPPCIDCKRPHCHLCAAVEPPTLSIPQLPAGPRRLKPDDLQGIAARRPAEHRFLLRHQAHAK